MTKLTAELLEKEVEKIILKNEKELKSRTGKIESLFITTEYNKLQRMIAKRFFIEGFLYYHKWRKTL